MSRKKIPGKQALVDALQEADGNMASVARKFGCHRSLVWQYIDRDPELKDLVDELNPYLHQDFITRLEEQYTATWQQQELEGEFCELEGSLFKRQWFQIIEHAPEGLRWSRYWDLAASVKTQADFSASACVALSEETGEIFIRDVIKLKEEWPTVRKVIIAIAQNESHVQLGVESAMHGLAAIQELQREPSLANISLRSVVVTKDKISRALSVASRAEAGKVKLIRGNWIADYLDEATVFPHGAHDDQVDAVSGAVQMIVEYKRRVLYA